MRDNQSESGRTLPLASDYLARSVAGARYALSAIFSAAMTVSRCVLDYKCLVVMSTQAARAVDTEGLDIVEYRDYSSSITTTLIALDRQYPDLEQRLRNRFRQGMRYYEVYKKGVIVGTAWIHPDGYRFVDEIGYLLPVRPGSVWLRDIFIVDQYRGQGLFSKIVAGVISQYYPDVLTLWSDTETHNKASVSAHRKCDFEIVGYMRALRLFNYFLVRDAPLSSLGTVSGYRMHKRFYVYGRRYRDYCRERIA